MRFRTKSRPRGLLKRSDQKRLTLLIVGLGMIFACFSVARQPAFWARLFPEEAPADATGQADSTHSPVLRSDLESAEMSADEFVSVGGTAGDGAVGDGAVGDGAVAVTARRPVLGDLETETPGNPGDPIPVVPADLLRTVKDDVIGVHSEESEAYFATMLMASRFAENKKYKPAQRGAFALFMDSPNGSRGMPWRIEGRLRRISKVKGRANSFGVTMLYDAWLTTPDSGDQLIHAVGLKANDLFAKRVESAPDQTVIYSLEDAPEVRFTGYFFKREGYANQYEGVSLAPLFLVGRLHDVPPPAVSSGKAAQLTPYLGWAALIICCAVGFILWSFAVSDGAHAQTRTHQLTKLPAVASFDDVTSRSVVESLQDLAETHVRPDVRVDHQAPENRAPDLPGGDRPQR